jgi:hypothetical protein
MGIQIVLHNYSSNVERKKPLEGQIVPEDKATAHTLQYFGIHGSGTVGTRIRSSIARYNQVSCSGEKTMDISQCRKMQLRRPATSKDDPARSWKCVGQVGADVSGWPAIQGQHAGPMGIVHNEMVALGVNRLS